MSKAKPRPPTNRSCRLKLTITQDEVDTVYHVRPIESGWHVRSYQFHKDDGTVYHVTQEISGKRECNCGSAEFNDSPCKHIRCAAIMGLLLSPREIQALRWHQEIEKGRH